MSQSSHTLLLMRHAKSAYPDGVVDHDRPLAPRGVREAGLAGEWLRSHAPGIDKVLCSTAVRTQETLACTGIDAPVSFVERLYGAVPGTVVDELNVVDDAVETVLVVAHEPTMSQVALGLAAAESSDATAAEAISTKFPTSAIAVLTTTGPWRALEFGTAALVEFHVPR